MMLSKRTDALVLDTLPYQSPEALGLPSPPRRTRRLGLAVVFAGVLAAGLLYATPAKADVLDCLADMIACSLGDPTACFRIAIDCATEN